MINVIRSRDRHSADHGWLQTNWHFSFSDYYDPENMYWSALRVFNDDVIQPGQGFPMHPHRDMEIITYVIDGQLEHRDQLGNRGVVHPGEVQVMSAGRGIVHSEFNPSPDQPVHLLQLWVMPRRRDNAPRWEQRQFSAGQRSGRLLPVVSSGQTPDTLAIDQDATIYVSKLSAGQRVSLDGGEKRHAYLFVIDGALTVNGKPVEKADQARAAGGLTLTIEATHDSEIILLDLP